MSLLLVIIMVQLLKVFKFWLSSSKNCFSCFNENPLKRMKNGFYFILKALLILKIFKFWCWLFDHVKITAWLEREGHFKNLWHHILVNSCITNVVQYLTKQRKPNNRETNCRTFVFFKKALYEVKVSSLHLSLNMFYYSSTWHSRKKSCDKL